MNIDDLESKSVSLLDIINTVVGITKESGQDVIRTSRNPTRSDAALAAGTFWINEKECLFFILLRNDEYADWRKLTIVKPHPNLPPESKGKTLIKMADSAT